MKKRIGIQGFLLFFAIITSILLSKVIFPKWQQEILDEVLNCIGITVILAGFLFRISARGYKSEKSDNGKKLVTDGPYSLIRHPMYFGTLLIGLGVILVLFEWWAFFLFFAVFLLIYIPQIAKEEVLLSGRFGSEYQAYFNNTPKYFPNPSSLFRQDFRDYLFFKLSWVKKELPSLIGVILFTIAIEIWEDTVIFGHTAYFRELIEIAFVILFFVTIFSVFFKR